MDAEEAVEIPEVADLLSEEDVRAVLQNLTDADLLRLKRAEEHYRHGTDFAEGDLLHGAFCQAITRERKCPRGVSFVRVIAMAMRSVAGHRRAQLRRQIPLEAALPVAGSDTPVAPIDWLRADGLDPEAHLIESESTNAVDAMLALFEDDEEAQYVILGAADGLKGAALCEAAGVTSNRLHYVFRKIRKRLGTDRDGWMP